MSVFKSQTAVSPAPLFFCSNCLRKVSFYTIFMENNQYFKRQKDVFLFQGLILNYFLFEPEEALSVDFD